MKYVITSTDAGMVPNQLEGFFYHEGGRYPFYFRARHGSWSLQVGRRGWATAYDGIEVAEGDDEDGGYWTHRESLEKLHSVIEAYLDEIQDGMMRANERQGNRSGVQGFAGQE